MSLPAHGSNPQYVYESFGLELPNKVIDFSVNINPFGVPDVIKEHWGSWINHVEDYPDPVGRRLVSYIADQEQIPTSSILLGNGGAALIRQLANMFACKRVLLIQPTFSEYERTCRTYNCKISNFILNENVWEIGMKDLETVLTQQDVVFLCHPNNPTGITYTKEILLEIITLCEKYKCFLVLDEAFYDFVPTTITMSSFIKEYEHLIIIRSLTKMFAIAGLRLGYVLASPAIIHQLRAYQSYWEVNQIALMAGEKIIKQTDFVLKTKQYFLKMRHKLLPQLRALGYLISESKVNFFLLRDPELGEQQELFLYLLKQGIVPRHTINYPGLRGRWLRFAIRQEAEMELLIEGLTLWKIK